VVCRLSVVCHTRAPYLTFSTDLQITCHLAGTLAGSNCVRWVDLGVEPPAQNCTCLLMIHQGAALISDFVFYRMTSITCSFCPIFYFTLHFLLDRKPFLSCLSFSVSYLVFPSGSSSEPPMDGGYNNAILIVSRIGQTGL